MRDNREPELSLVSLASSKAILTTAALGLLPWLTNLYLLLTKRAKKQEMMPALGRLRQEEYYEFEASLVIEKDGVWGYLD